MRAHVVDRREFAIVVAYGDAAVTDVKALALAIRNFVNLANRSEFDHFDFVTLMETSVVTVDLIF